MKGWNDPPPPSVVSGGDKATAVSNPFRGHLMRNSSPSTSNHKRSFSGGNVHFNPMNHQSQRNPQISTSNADSSMAPGNVPSLFVPNLDRSNSVNNRVPAASYHNNPYPPNQLPFNDATNQLTHSSLNTPQGNNSALQATEISRTQSWSNFQSPTMFPTPVHLDQASLIQGNSLKVYSPISLPGSACQPSIPQSEGERDELAAALQERLKNVQLHSSSIINSNPNVSPLCSPFSFSPTRKQGGNNNSAIDSLTTNFAVDETKSKVDELFRIFTSDPSNEKSQVEKLETKLDLFRKSWNALSDSLCSLLSKLVFCITTNQTDLAMRCFIKMSVDYSKEVMMWSMAFKRLIRYFEEKPL